MHLPLIPLGDEALSPGRLLRTVDAAREHGFAAVCANDHFLFRTPWLDGPTALAAVAERAGAMELATTVALVALRGPVALAKALAALDLLAEGGVVAGVGPGSSAADHDAVGAEFEARWPVFDAAVIALRALLEGQPAPGGGRLEPVPATPIPVWIGSWGSTAGLRRVARLGDGWLASAYNTTPDRFATAHADLAGHLRARGREPERFPNALATMWTWVTEDAREADRVLREVLAPLLRRDPVELRDQLCVGPPERCAELLARYAAAGCRRVLFWPVGDEPRQLALLATRVLPAV